MALIPLAVISEVVSIKRASNDVKASIRWVKNSKSAGFISGAGSLKVSLAGGFGMLISYKLQPQLACLSVQNL
ncbi:MAG: hypothetical protein KGI06_06130, partial [Candidatus Micrarchaeota archaeon]|nr:hypothetical protein [Candidatus Micrarchaeota archaeon]